MTEHEIQPTSEAQPSPLPPAVTEHPAWRLIWQKLLAPTPDELAAAAERDATDRDVA